MLFKHINKPIESIIQRKAHHFRHRTWCVSGFFGFVYSYQHHKITILQHFKFWGRKVLDHKPVQTVIIIMKKTKRNKWKKEQHSTKNSIYILIEFIVLTLFQEWHEPKMFEIECSLLPKIYQNERMIEREEEWKGKREKNLISLAFSWNVNKPRIVLNFRINHKFKVKHKERKRERERQRGRLRFHFTYCSQYTNVLRWENNGIDMLHALHA